MECHRSFVVARSPRLVARKAVFERRDGSLQGIAQPAAYDFPDAPFISLGEERTDVEGRGETRRDVERRGEAGMRLFEALVIHYKIFQDIRHLVGTHRYLRVLSISW